MRSALLALALTLLGVVPAAADDVCLEGASELADQRALAALREVTDTACPCAGFGSRPEYQACARAALRSALAAGDLRAACGHTAKVINRGAVCGTSKVACGRFDPSASRPLSCRVQDAANCTDGRRVHATPCPAETHCADVVDWTASTCVDVREDGPYVPGVRVVSFTKQSVATYCTGGTGTCSAAPLGAGCPCNAATDCESGVCETQPRTLETSVWYPAPVGSGPIDPRYDAVLDAPLDDARGPYPILMFSHGSCGYPNQSLFLTPLIASYGFVVAAPPHPGNTLFDYPTCGLRSAQVASFLERPQDILFVLDGMLAESADPASPFFGAIDETRIGMSGHSFGGLTVYLTVPLDSRFKVALPMAPAVLGSPVLHIPSLNMLGQIDTVVNLPAIRTAYANALPPKYLVEIENAGHYAFSDLCFPSPDCNPPTTLTQDEAHDAVRRYALPFLERYLASDERFAPFLSLPPGPGFAVQEAL